MRKEFNLTSIDLGEEVKNDDYVTISKELSTINKMNFREYTFMGCQIGKVALYELLLSHKKINLNFDEEEWSEYLKFLKNCMITCIAGERILNQFKPDCLIMYNTLYATNHAMRQIAERANISVYHIHGGENLSNREKTLFISAKNTFEYRKELKQKWELFENRALSKKSILNVTSHFKALQSAQNILVYSIAKSENSENIYLKFPIKRSQKIILACLSSYDERFAGESCGALTSVTDTLFLTQIEWIGALIEYFKDKEEYFLLIRVHPREFPNRRDSVKSEHAAKLAEHFVSLPPNIAINWPEDKISIYDLADHASLVLNAWSSVGEELALLGLPVLIYSPELVMYSPRINYLASSKDEYFLMIEKLSTMKISLENIRNTFRWFGMKLENTTIEILQIKRSFLPENILRFSRRVQRKIYAILKLADYSTYIKRMEIGRYKKTVNVLGISQMLIEKKASLLDAGVDSRYLLSEEAEVALIRDCLKSLKVSVD